jgi:hypothetical protein
MKYRKKTDEIDSKFINLEVRKIAEKKRSANSRL